MSKTISLEVLEGGNLKLIFPNNETIDAVYTVVLNGEKTYIENIDTELEGIDYDVMHISTGSYLKDGYFEINRREIHKKVRDLHLENLEAVKWNIKDL